MTQRVALKAGGEVALSEWRNESRVMLEANFAAPPGSRLELVILGAAVWVKVRACRRTDNTEGDRFRIEGRFVNLSREQRSYLEQLL